MGRVERQKMRNTSRTHRGVLACVALTSRAFFDVLATMRRPRLPFGSLALVALFSATAACGSAIDAFSPNDATADDTLGSDGAEGGNDTGSAIDDTGTTNDDTGGADDTGAADDTGGADDTGSTGDSTSTDTGNDTGVDAGVDTGVDTGPFDPCAAGPDGTACKTSAGANGLCKSNVCAACVEPTDDAKCNAAYGSSSVGSMCIGGACVSSECRADGDCASVGKAGEICGLASPNMCGKCAADSQCKAASYGPTTICNVGAGACVPAACAPANAVCSANAADFCCSGATTGSQSCISGNCCSSAQCGSGGVCRNNTCTTCATVTNNIYYVDPVGGSDTSSTGSSTCAFRSIARATQFINGVFGAAIPSGTKIYLMNDSLLTNTTRGEVFPISVLNNVTIQSDPAGAIHTIEVTAGSSGFNLTRASSGIASLVVDGKTGAIDGVTVSGTSSNATTVLTGVTIRDFRNDGIYVTAGGVSVGAGVLSTANGQSPTGNGFGSGLHVTGGNATIDVPAGGAKTGFDSNLANGILVTGAGSVTITGVPDVTGYPANQNPPAVSAGTGTVTANQNTLANLAVAQNGNNTPSNTIRGLVTWGGKGNGMSLTSGSNVNVRNSVSVKNALAGVRIVSSFGAPITGTNAAINLGPDNLGKNIFQTPTNGNTNAGICIDGQFFNTNQTLNAKANYFSGVDCSAAVATPPTVVKSSLAGCAGGIDVGLETVPATGAQQTNIRVNLDNCKSL